MERLVMYIINQYNLDLTNIDDLKILGEKVKDAYFDYLYGELSYILLKRDIENTLNKEFTDQEVSEKILKLRINPYDFRKLDVFAVNEEEEKRFNQLKYYLIKLKEVGFFEEDYVNTGYIDSLEKVNYTAIEMVINDIRSAKKRINLGRMGFGVEVQKLLDKYNLNEEYEKTVR